MTNNPNSVQPFRLTRAQALTCDQDHNYADEQKAFNSGLMNDAVYKFKRYEDASLSYAGISKHAEKDVQKITELITFSIENANAIRHLWLRCGPVVTPPWQHQ